MKFLYRADYGNPESGFYWGKSTSEDYSHFRVGFFLKGLGTYHDCFDDKDKAKCAFRIQLRYKRIITTKHFTRRMLTPYIGGRYKDKYVVFEGFSMDTNVKTEKSSEKA